MIYEILSTSMFPLGVLGLLSNKWKQKAMQIETLLVNFEFF